MVRRRFFSDIVCLYIAIICQLYMRFYQTVLYYHKIPFPVDFFLIVYQYIAIPLFLFFVIKPVGSVIQQNFRVGIAEKANLFCYIFAIMVILYVVFVVLMEMHIIPIVFLMSPVRFLVYALFGGMGFFVGLLF